MKMMMMMIIIIRFTTQATKTSTPTNYIDVAYDLLTYNMASASVTIESNDKSRHCHRTYISLLRIYLMSRSHTNA